MIALLRVSQFLMIFPIGTFLYDLVNEWFVHARFNIRSMHEWWSAVNPETMNALRPVVINSLGAPFWSGMMDTPAPLVLLVLPATLYIIYRIVFLIQGGKGGSGYNYKSRF